MNTLTNTSYAQLSAIKLHGYRIELTENRQGKPVAKYSKLLTSGKNKGNYKPLEAYYFDTNDKREAWVNKVISNIKKQESAKSALIEAKKEVRNNMQHPFKVGQIYYDSWGWEQTNIDFYEVIEVKEKSVLLQPIGKNFVESEGLSSMASMVTPDITSRIGEAQRKNVLFYMGSDNKPVFYLKSEYGSFTLYTKGDRGVYCSWYA